MSEIKIFLNNIEMDNLTKRKLRDFIGVNTIQQAKKLLGLPTVASNRVYRLLDELYTARERQREIQREQAVKVIQERRKAQKVGREIREVQQIKRGAKEFIIQQPSKNQFAYKQVLKKFKGKKVKVFTIRKGVVVHSTEIEIPTTAYNKWWDEKGAYYFLEGDSGDQYTPLLNPQLRGMPVSEDEPINEPPAKIIVSSNLELAENRVEQVFREGIRNCMFKPIVDFCDMKIEESKSRTTIWRYKNIKKKALALEEEYTNGVPEDKVQGISNELQVNISVEMPFAEQPFINCKSEKAPLNSFKFINTRMNHIDLNEVVDTSTFIPVEAEELKALAEQYIKDGKYFDYLKNKEGEYTKIRTLENQFCSKCDWLEMFNEFEKDSGLLNCKMDYINDDCAWFVKNGIHNNQSRLFKEGVPQKQIDMTRAYANFYKCEDYEGFLGKITDFRKCDNFDNIGYYTVSEFDFTNVEPRVKQLIDMLGYLYEGNVYPSVDLKMWEKHGVGIKVCEGCWGNKIDFRFPDAMYERVGEGDHPPRGYSKWCGIQQKFNFNQSFYMRGDREYFENMKAHLKGTAEVGMWEDGEGYITYPKQKGFTNAPIVGFVMAYQRLSLIRQMLDMDLSKVYSVCVDGIYYDDHDFKLHKTFEYKDTINQVKGSESYCSGIHNPEHDEFEGDSEVSEWATAEPREFGMVELFKGAGGNGKTHYNLTDEGLMRKIYVAPSWKLATTKAKEYKCEANVIANLLHETKRFGFLRYNNVFIIDESSMISEETKLALKSIYQGCKLIFCGDNGFQLPPTEGTEMNEVGFDRVVEFKTNYRFTCGKHSQIANEVRGMIEAKEDNKKIIDFIIDSYENIKEPIGYKPTDMILCSQTRCVKCKNENCDCDGNNFSLQWTKKFGKTKWKTKERSNGYCNGDIVIGDKPLKVKCENRHGYTIHSVQGETYEETIYIDARKIKSGRMGYTAISRARRWEQIKIIL